MKKEKCYLCGKKRNNGKHGLVFFNFKGYDFKIVKTGSECVKCAKKFFISHFKEYEERLIKDAKGCVINWSFYSGFHKEEQPRLNQILISLGVFSYESKKNWEIFGGGMILNPGQLGVLYYFKRKQDVLEFAKVNYGRTLYFCEIRRISQIIKQDKFKREV